VGKDRASSVASAINLRPGDLPADAGWSTQKPTPAATLHRIDAQWSSCYGGRYAQVLADVASDLFLGRGNVSASSDVEIFKTPALAAADFKAFDRPHGTACAKTQIRRSFATGSSSPSVNAGARSLPSTAAGTAGTFAVRISVDSGSRRYTFDETVFLEGQAEVTVSLVGAGTPPAALERTLTALVVGRAKQALG
jgi:hypothetical protein